MKRMMDITKYDENQLLHEANAIGIIDIDDVRTKLEMKNRQEILKIAQI